MAYTLYLYIPANLYWSVSGYGSGYGQGDSTPCATLSIPSTSTALTISFGLTSGYTFNDWKINEGGSIRYAYTQTLSYTNTAGAANVYIKAEVSVSTIQTFFATLNFHDNGGSGGPGSVSGSVTGTSSTVTIQIPAITPTREGYDFQCWQYTSPNGSVYTYQPGNYASVTGDPYGRSYDLYAIWEEKTVYKATLAFNANGGTGAPASITQTSYAKQIPITVPSTKPTRTGYTFLYWQYTSAAGEVSQYNPGDTVNATGKEGGVTYTLYAIWGESGGGAYLRINGVWTKATPYVYTGGAWKKAAPYIYTGGAWKKGT